MLKPAPKSTETLPHDDITVFHRRLQAWYERHGRAHLPWRNTQDPYAIYISEIMLQQTQVATVLTRYYFPFLEKFPTLSALADAPREEVLKAWQGLGYYTRAINVHKAAQAAAPHLPGTPDALQALPGIGRNTAHALAAFGFRAPVAIMEANVKRVLCRIYALAAPTDDALWSLADGLLNRANPFDYNQAMMDIGALVCTRSKPDCPACPANHFCQGQENPTAYPAPKAAKKERVRRKIILVHVSEDGRIHATPRSSRFLHGMYHFEETDVIARSDSDEAIQRSGLLRSARNDDPAYLGHVRQVYSHFTLEAEVYLKLRQNTEDENLHTLEQLEKLPHSKAEEKILILLKHWQNSL